MFTQKNFTKETLEKLSAMMTKEIPDEIAKGIDVDTYLRTCRVPLNVTILELVFGAELDKKDKNGNTRFDKKGAPITSFNKPLPKLDDLSNLVMMLNNFIVNVEQPYLASVGYNANCFSGADDDMSIPSLAVGPMPTLEKFSHKKLNEYIFNDNNGLGRRIITGMDILPLASIAEKARKAKNLNTMLLIGGIALVITGVIVAVHVVNNKDEKDEVDAESLDTSAAEGLDMSEAEALDTSAAEDLDMSAAEDMPVVDMPA